MIAETKRNVWNVYTCQSSVDINKIPVLCYCFTSHDEKKNRFVSDKTLSLTFFMLCWDVDMKGKRKIYCNCKMKNEKWNFIYYPKAIFHWHFWSFPLQMNLFIKHFVVWVFNSRNAIVNASRNFKQILSAFFIEKPRFDDSIK